MKVILFDLGKTLDDRDVLLTGARETLQAVQAMRDSKGRLQSWRWFPISTCWTISSGIHRCLFR
jgi:hypothetical protein